MRLGARRGLLGIGRERLAQAHYHAAVAHLEGGRPREALFDVELTLQNNRRHLRAIKLRERLLGERLWGDDGWQMRTFLWGLVDRPRTDAPAPFGRPDPLRLVPDDDATKHTDEP